MKPLLTLTALIAVSAAMPALAEDTSAQSETSIKSMSNGGMKAEEKTESTDANGTVSNSKTTKNVDVDSNGDKKTTVDIQDSKDPKGLFNKSTTKVHNEAVEKNGKTEYTHKKTVNGKTVEESDDMQQQ